MRILLHLSHAARSHSTLIVVSEDTDVFILCLSFKNFVQSSIFVKCGTQTRIRNISIRTVVRTIGQNLCSSLLGMHAYTGCDTLSAKSGRGKISPLRIVKEHKAFQDMFKLLGTDWELSDNLFKKLQELICRIYCSRPQTTISMSSGTDCSV